MKITFLGAAQCVTGSKYLLEHGRRTYLIDAGLYQERDLAHRNWESLPVDVSRINAVFLTHAHTDHCGYLPVLVKQGFKGKIYATPATREITKLSLIDSAHLQEADAAYKLKRHKREGRKGRFPEEALYTEKEARAVFAHFRKVDYEQPLELANGLTVTFFDAGHILGSAMIEVRAVADDGRETVCIFSGDIGRPRKPILQDPHVFSRADCVVMEATYGDKTHEDMSVALDKAAAIIRETASAGGKVIIPSFAINRTQEVMFYLDQMLDAGKIPALPLYVDSPMAADVTDIFDMYSADFDEESRKILETEQSVFHYPKLIMTRDSEASKAINAVKGPAIILAGSGMCTGGRIKHHLFRELPKAESTILFIGYQAQGTLGRILIEKPQEVRIFGQMVPVRARIAKINGFSGHADQPELLQWLSTIAPPPKKVFVVHSEKNTAETFASVVREKSPSEVIVPAYGETADV